MEITYTDDKKGKYQSHEAIVHHTSYDSTGEVGFDGIGYGATKEEAKAHLIHDLTKMQEALANFIAEVSK